MSVNFKKFGETLGSTGAFLKSKDFEDGREVMVLPWIFNGEVVKCLAYYEAWVWDEENGGQKKNKKKPARLSFEDYSEGNFNIEDYDISTSSYQGKVSRDNFKGTLAFLFKDIATNEIKLASFSQVTLCTSLMKYLDSDSKFYIKNLENKVLVIGKEDERRWSASVKDDDDNYISRFDSQLEDFKFSWQAYLDGVDPFEDGDTYQDVLDLIGDTPEEKKTPAKKAPAKKAAAKKEESNEDDDMKAVWYKLKTPKGTPLADLDLTKMQDLVNILEQKKNYKELELYKAAVFGLRVRKEEEGLEEDEIGF